MAQRPKGERLDHKDLEVEVGNLSIEDGTNQQLRIGGGVNSAFGTDTIGTTTEDGYIECEVDIAGTLTIVKVPYWLDV